MPQHQDDSALKDLWARRRDLTEAEWGRLYAIVVAALSSYRPQILASLKEDNDVYVQDFFQDKVLRPDLGSRLDHVGALRVAYKRYLHDRYDSEQLRGTEELSGNDIDGLGDTATANPGPHGDPDNEFQALAEASIGLAAVHESAARWLRNAKPWVPAMLGLHHCPDRDQSEPLVRLAKRLGIRSYHYKAERLGITGLRDRPWAQTLLGQWVGEDLKIQISNENQSLISAALKILCHEALIWAEQQEAAR